MQQSLKGHRHFLEWLLEAIFVPLELERNGHREDDSNVFDQPCFVDPERKPGRVELPFEVLLGFSCESCRYRMMF